MTKVALLAPCPRRFEVEHWRSPFHVDGRFDVVETYSTTDPKPYVEVPYPAGDWSLKKVVDEDGEERIEMAVPIDAPPERQPHYRIVRYKRRARPPYYVRIYGEPFLAYELVP